MVFGDHGQTMNGDHGGGAPEEVDSALFALHMGAYHQIRSAYACSPLTTTQCCTSSGSLVHATVKHVSVSSWTCFALWEVCQGTLAL